MTHADTPASPPDDLINAADALGVLGAKSRTTLERLIRAGKVTVYTTEVNPRVRWFSRAQLEPLATPRAKTP